MVVDLDIINAARSNTNTRVLICFMKSKLEMLRLRQVSQVKTLFSSVRLVLTKLIMNG